MKATILAAIISPVIMAAIFAIVFMVKDGSHEIKHFVFDFKLGLYPFAIMYLIYGLPVHITLCCKKLVFVKNYIFFGFFSGLILVFLDIFFMPRSEPMPLLSIYFIYLLYMFFGVLSAVVFFLIHYKLNKRLWRQ